MHKPLTVYRGNQKYPVQVLPVVCIFFSKLVLKQGRVLQILKDNEAILQSLENQDKLEHQ